MPGCDACMALLTGCVMYLIFEVPIFFIGVVHAVCNQLGMPAPC